VITAVDEKVTVTRCEGRGDCQNGQACLTHELWCSLSDQIHDFLHGISLGQLVEKEHVQEVAARQGQQSQEQPVQEQRVSNL
jgi:Rrf2 family iron-sulfur cluster assembly transcriptional regulator